MTVFRVEKTKDFTVMSNHHLRNKTLSLKAKRLLSLMLSLPEDLSINLSALGTDYKAGGIKSNLTEGSRCPVYEPERILALMEKPGIKEKGFALLMNVAPFTVRLWTSGDSQPSGTAMRLMQIFETAPEIVSKIAGESERCILQW